MGIRKKQQQVSATFLSHLKSGEAEQAYILISARKNQVNLELVWQGVEEDIQAGKTTSFYTILKIPAEKDILPNHKNSQPLTLACQNGTLSVFSPSVVTFFS